MLYLIRILLELFVYLNRVLGGFWMQQPLVYNRSGERRMFSNRVGITDV